MLAYFDCFSGLAGDMIVAALLDAGADWDQFRASISTLGLPNVKLRLERVTRCGLGASLFVVENPPQRVHRSLSEILEIIDRGELTERVRNDARRVFRNLAKAEAKVHDCPIEEIHFHEVGAVDAIVDIVGSCLCLEMLNVDEVCFAAVPVGSGAVTTEHGVLPVPAPATLLLLSNNRLYSGGQGELTTPTGAAIVTTIGTQVTGIPELTVMSIGCGAGTRDDGVRPNVLRVVIGDRGASGKMATDEVAVLTCQVDDMSGEELGLLAERLRADGALDVVFIPIYMKKGRPGVMIEVVSPIGEADRLAELVLRESSTFGLRYQLVRRCKLTRECIELSLSGERVRVKLGYLGGQVVQVSPEYEDCRRIALSLGESLREVYRRASTAAWRKIEASQE